MNMRLYSFLTVACAGFTLMTPFVVDASELQTVGDPTDVLILQMADGSFYAPSVPLVAPTRSEMLERLRDTAASTSSIVLPVPVENPLSIPPPNDALMMRLAIERGKALLTPGLTNPARQKKLLTELQKDDTWREMTLAVWHRETDTMTTVHLRKSGAKLQLLGKDDDPFDVTVKRSNGINTEFIFEEPGTRLVVAVRYPIITVTGSGKNRKITVDEVLYTPYAAAFHTPEMITEGRRVLDGHIAAAEAAFRASAVRSRAVSGTLLADRTDTALVTALALIEHTDRTVLERDPTRALEVFYVTLALNPEDAYAYSKSSAGATGIMQFMPTTYARLAKRMEYGLLTDALTGSRNVANAVKAQMAFTDLLEADVKGKAKIASGGALPDRMLMDEYIAAAYNGGGPRVKKAIEIWDHLWSTTGTSYAKLDRAYQAARTERKQQEAKLKTATIEEKKALTVRVREAKAKEDKLAAQRAYWKTAELKLETKDYVRKYRVARELLSPPVLTLAAAVE